MQFKFQTSETGAYLVIIFISYFFFSEHVSIFFENSWFATSEPSTHPFDWHFHCVHAHTSPLRLIRVTLDKRTAGACLWRLLCLALNPESCLILRFLDTGAQLFFICLLRSPPAVFLGDTTWSVVSRDSQPLQLYTQISLPHTTLNKYFHGRVVLNSLHGKRGNNFIFFWGMQPLVRDYTK